MKREHMNPHSESVIGAAIERIQNMTEDEALGFLTTRSPGVEETDMTGMFAVPEEPARKRRSAKATQPPDQLAVR